MGEPFNKSKMIKMKTTIISILLFLTGLALNGQIQLEHSYGFSGTLTEIDEDEFKYYIMDVPLKQCRIFNEDHTPYKTINLQVPSGYFLTDIKFVSRKTFNPDENIELLYMYSKADLINSEYVYTYGMKVINEQGTVLLNLPGGGFAELKSGSNGTKLLAYTYTWSESFYLVSTNVYSLGETTMSASSVVQPSITIYPNPADETVHVKLTDPSLLSGGILTLSDMSGRQVFNQPLQPGTEHVSIGTERMVAGTYILNLLSNDGTRLSEKFEKR
jgi:hypothetical protein